MVPHAFAGIPDVPALSCAAVGLDTAVVFTAVDDPGIFTVARTTVIAFTAFDVPSALFFQRFWHPSCCLRLSHC